MSLQPNELTGSGLRTGVSLPSRESEVVRNSGRKRSTVRRVTLLLLLSATLGAGCVNFQEKRTITAFQSGLEAQNLEALRGKSTDRFNSLALRHPSADEALKQLKLPDGKFKVLEVEEDSENSKKITVGFGEDHRRKIQYRLVKDESGKNWKVDDIYLRQRSGDKALVMAVTEQMDVLLSAREFYEAWASGDRQRVLSSSNPEMASQLETLPPSILAGYTTRLVGSKERTSTFRPEAHISGEEAVVRLNRSHGTLVMMMDKNESGSWQVKDLSLEARGKEGESANIKSLVEMAKVTGQAMRFLDSWAQSDREGLKSVTQERFYSSGLAPANLKAIDLPASYEVMANVDVKILETHADVVVQDEAQTVCLRLNETKVKSGVYVVSDVTIYDMENHQKLSLSSAITANPVAELFVDSLIQRDHKMLQYSSTMDLSKRTWGRVSEQTLKLIPLPVKNLEQFRMAETNYAGEITQVHFVSDQQKLTLVLLDQGGKVVVDDLLISSLGSEEEEKNSLKAYLSAVVPVFELAASIHNNAPQDSLRLVTDDFYDRVFSLATAMPEASYSLLEYVSNGSPKVKSVAREELLGRAPSMTANLIQPGKREMVSRHHDTPVDTTVEFKTDAGMMQVSLREEQGLLRVDDAVVVSPGNEVVLRLKQSMRMELANRRTRSMIQTVSGEIRELPPKVSLSQPKAGAAAAKPEAQAEIPVDASLKNALYEEYAGSTPRVNMTQRTALKDSSVSPSNSGPPPLQKLAPEVHLLLKPIPLE